MIDDDSQVAIAEETDEDISVSGDSTSDAVRRRVISAEQSATYKIRRTHAKLDEASNTTLTAASSILDGLDRASNLLDELNANADPADERGKEIRNALRDELMSIMDIMQFQDIASQQLATASSTLSQAEERLVNVTRALNGESVDVFPMESERSGALPLVFDENATMDNRAERQAAVDLASLNAKGGASD